MHPHHGIFPPFHPGQLVSSPIRTINPMYRSRELLEVSPEQTKFQSLIQVSKGPIQGHPIQQLTGNIQNQGIPSQQGTLTIGQQGMLKQGNLPFAAAGVQVPQQGPVQTQLPQPTISVQQNQNLKSPSQGHQPIPISRYVIETKEKALAKESVISNSSNQQANSETSDSLKAETSSSIFESINSKKRLQIEELVKNNEKLMKMLQKQRHEIREGKEAEMNLKLAIEENHRLLTMVRSLENDVISTKEEVVQLKQYETQISLLNVEIEKLRAVIQAQGSQIEHWKNKCRELQHLESERIRFQEMAKTAESSFQRLIEENQRIALELNGKISLLEKTKREYIELELAYSAKDDKIMQLLDEHEKMEELVKRQSIELTDKERQDLDRAEPHYKNVSKKFKSLYNENNKLTSLLNQRVVELEKAKEGEGRYIVQQKELERMNELHEAQDRLMKEIQNELQDLKSIQMENEAQGIVLHDYETKMKILVDDNEKLSELIEIQFQERYQLTVLKSDAEFLYNKNQELEQLLKRYKEVKAELLEKISGLETVLATERRDFSAEKERFLNSVSDLESRLRSLTVENRYLNEGIQKLLVEKNELGQRLVEFEGSNLKLKKENKVLRQSHLTKVDISEMLKNLAAIDKASRNEVKEAEREAHEARTSTNMGVSGGELLKSVNIGPKEGIEPTASAQDNNPISSEGEISDTELERLESESKAITSKLEKIESRLLKTYNRREELLNNMKYVKDIKENVESRFKMVVEENHKLVMTVANLQREIDALNLEKQGGDQRLEINKKEQENLLRILDTKDQQLNLYQQNVEEQSNIINERIKQINSLNNINENLVKENERLINYYNISIKENELRQLTDKNGVEKEFYIVKERNLLLEREVKQLAEENSNAGLEMSELKKENDRLKGEIKQKEQEPGNRNIEEEPLKVSDNSLEEREKKYENEITYLNQQVTQFKQMAENSRNETSKLYELLKARKVANDDLTSKLEITNREKARIDDENSQLKSVNVQFNERCQILEREVEKLQRDVEKRTANH